MRQICRKRLAPRWTSRPREHICVNRVCWCLKYSFHSYTKKAVKCSLGKMINWRCFCQISDLCAAWELHLWNLCSCSSRLAASLKWGRSFFFFFLSSEVSVAGCNFVSQSQSIRRALHLHHRSSSGKRGDGQTSVCVRMWLPLHQRGLPVLISRTSVTDSLCLCVCMLVYVLRAFVCFL